MAKGNIYKPRYFFSNRSRSKITIYKDGYLRRFYERRGRRVKRGGLFRRYVLVAKNRKWTKARRFIRPVRRSAGLRMNRANATLLNGRPLKRRYILSFFQKQRLRYFYGKRKESSFRAAFQEYRIIQGVTSRSFFSLLESRLDRALYRRRIFPTLYGCRQFIHYHGVLINESIEKSPRYQIEVGDSLSIPNFAWRSVYWDLFCRVYYRRWGRYLIARRFFSRFKKKIFKFRSFTFQRPPRTRNIQKKYWSNFGSPFSRAKIFKLFQKNRSKFNQQVQDEYFFRFRRKRFYIWKWLNRINSSKKSKKNLYNPFVFNKTNQRSSLLLRLLDSQSFGIKNRKNFKNRFFIKKRRERRERRLIKWKRNFSKKKNIPQKFKSPYSYKIKSKKKSRSYLSYLYFPLSRRIVRRNLGSIRKSFQLNTSSIRYDKSYTDQVVNSLPHSPSTSFDYDTTTKRICGLDTFSQGAHSVNKIIYHNFVQHFLETNRLSDKSTYSSNFQLFLAQRNSDLETIQLETKSRKENPQNYSARPLTLLNRKREKFATYLFNQKFRKKFIPNFIKKRVNRILRGNVKTSSTFNSIAKSVKAMSSNFDNKERGFNKKTSSSRGDVSINPIVKKRLRTGIRPKQVHPNKNKKKRLKLYSKFASQVRRQKKFRYIHTPNRYSSNNRFNRYSFKKKTGYLGYVRRKRTRFFRRRRYRLRRQRSYPRIKRVHRYFPNYFQTDLRTLRMIKIATPSSNFMYSGFRLSPAKIFSFYKSRGYLFITYLLFINLLLILIKKHFYIF